MKTQFQREGTGNGFYFISRFSNRRPHLLRNTGKHQRARAELRNWWIIEMEALSYLHVLGWLFVSLMLK